MGTPHEADMAAASIGKLAPTRWSAGDGQRPPPRPSGRPWSRRRVRNHGDVAHAEIDLKVGGRMRTHYDPKGTIGDPNTIENTILAFEPNRLLVIQVANPPEKFPFKDAVRKIWTVVPISTTRARTQPGCGSSAWARR